MGTYLFPLIERIRIAEGTMLFRFSLEGVPFPFCAGQYADFTLEKIPSPDAHGNTRSFSLASSPNEREYIEIAIRMPDRPTAFKQTLRDMPLGTRVRVSAPMGNFTLHENTARPGVLIAGGIGITPVLSMLRAATEARLPHRLTLMRTDRTPQRMAFGRELADLAEKNPNLTVLSVATRAPDAPAPQARGRITSEFLRAHIPAEDIPNAFWYVVGSPAMVSGVAALIPRLGADPDAIRTEEFAGY